MEGSSRSAVVVRPMGVGEVLDAGIKLARASYRPLVVISAWAIVPAFVVGAVLSLISGASVFATGLTLIGQIIAGFALIVACGQLIAPSGSVGNIDPGSIYGLVRKRTWDYVIWSVLIAVMAGPLVLLFPLGIYLGVRWSVSWISLILDGDGPSQCFGRSWSLTKGAWWHTFGILFVFVVMYTLILAVVNLVFSVIAGVLILGGAPLVGTIVTSLGSAAGEIFVAPVAAGIEVVLYYELRARREGFDLSSQAGQQWQAQ